MALVISSAWEQQDWKMGPLESLRGRKRQLGNVDKDVRMFIHGFLIPPVRCLYLFFL